MTQNLLSQVCLLVMLSLGAFNCKSLPEYEDGKALLGIYVDLAGLGKMGRVSENFSVMEINKNIEYASNSRNGASVRNNEPFSTIVLPDGVYVMKSVCLGGNYFLFTDQLQPCEIKGKKNYFAGSYTLDIAKGLNKITHTFAQFEENKDDAERKGFLEYLRKQKSAWAVNGEPERVHPFTIRNFNKTRSYL